MLHFPPEVKLLPVFFLHPISVTSQDHHGLVYMLREVTSQQVLLGLRQMSFLNVIVVMITENTETCYRLTVVYEYISDEDWSSCRI